MNKPLMRLAALSLFAVAGTAGAGTDPLALGPQVYKESCARCHDTGTEGAPVLSKMSEWTDRTAILWSDVQLQHADLGFLTTADKDQENGITAEQMKAATNYMVSIVSKK